MKAVPDLKRSRPPLFLPRRKTCRFRGAERSRVQELGAVLLYAVKSKTLEKYISVLKISWTFRGWRRPVYGKKRLPTGHVQKKQISKSLNQTGL